MYEAKKGEIIIYKDAEGPEVAVKLEGETVWMTMAQIAQLFGTQRAAISKHIKNIYSSSELTQKATVSKMETVQKEGGRQVTRSLEYYNLDMVISIGYRVNSRRATQFRVWATQKLRDYVLQGYIVNQERLKKLELQQGKLKELEQANRLFREVIESHRASGYEKDLLNIITDYTNTWFVLNQYDKGELHIENVSTRKPSALNYAEAKKAVEKFKVRLMAKKEAGELFGQESGAKFQAVLGSIDQTYDGKELYASIEEKAAHLLYFCIKDHPFADGNKRIGSLMFLLYLVENNSIMNKRGERKINDSALAALALLIAESKPTDKDVMVKLVVNLINKK